MRLLLFSLYYAPEPTATGKYNAEMVEWLAARGHRVDVITGLPHYPEWRVYPGYERVLWRVEQINGVRVFRAGHYVPAPERLTASGRIALELTFSLNALPYWLRNAVGSKYDVVFVVCPPMQLGVYARLYGVLRNVPWVFHVQDLQVDAALRLGMLDSRLARFLYSVEEYLLKKATRVSTISEAMRARIVQKGVLESKTWLVPNWAEVDFIRPLPRANAFRRSLGVGDEDIVVMYAGNMGEKQGLELVLEVAQDLRDQISVQFVLIGSGAAKSRLEVMAHRMGLPNIKFLPVQPKELLPQVLASGDIHLVIQKRGVADLVMPSKLGNILAAGRPVVATADEGTDVHNVVVRNRVGLAVPPEDRGALAEAIKQLACAHELRQELGLNARDYAERCLDKEVILTELEARFYELLEADKR